MANEIYKNIKSRHKLKNGTEAEWNLTNIFIPLKGEPIIYNPDETHLNYRYKMGDGVNDVKQLPFVGLIQEGLGKNSITSGTNNIAGTKCFTVTDVTVSENGQVILTLDNVQGLEVNQECRFKLDAEYYATILGIDGNNVQLDILSTDLYVLEIYSPDIENGEYSDENNPYLVRQSDGTDTEKNTLFIIGHPEIGTDRIIGTNAVAFDSNNNAAVLNSFASGTNNIATGAYSAAFGANNISPYGSIVAGKNNDARLGEYGAIFGAGNKFTKISRCSFVAGSNNTLGANYTTSFGGSNKSLGIGSTTFGLANEALSNYSTAIGYYTKTTGNYQLAVGSGNNPLSDAIFMIGNGSKNSNGEMVRSNAFVVKYNGNTVIPLGDLEVTKGSATIGNKLNVNTILAKVYSGTNNGVVLNTQNNKATGNYSIAGGSSCSATALCSTAFGAQTNANHVGSFIAGGVNTSTCDYQTIFGKHADTSKNSLFMIGFGTASAKKNVFEVSNVGKAYLGNADIDTTNDTSIVTKKYADTKLSKTGGIFNQGEKFKLNLSNTNYEYYDIADFSIDYNGIDLAVNNNADSSMYASLRLGNNGINIDGSQVEIKNVVTPTEDGDAINKKYVDDLHLTKAEGENATQQILNATSWSATNQQVIENTDVIKDGGSPLTGAYGAFSAMFGGKSQAKGKRGFAAGTSTIALGNYSTAFGDQTFAKGLSSLSTGCKTSAIGDNSFTTGVETIASGTGSYAGGYQSNALADFSFTSGNKTRAQGLYSASFGAETIAGNSCQFIIGKHNNNKFDTLFEVGNGSGEGETPKSNAFEVYLDGHAELRTQGETDNSIITKKYIDGTEQTFTANIIYDRITNTTPQTTTYIYIQKGNTIEARGSVYIDISNAEDLGYTFKIQLPKEAKYTGVTLGNILLQLGNGTGYWYQFTGIPCINNKNYITIIPNGLRDSYSPLELCGFQIPQLLESINIENASTIASTISQIQIDFAISYTVNE